MTLKAGSGVVQGHLKMMPIDRSCTTYLSVILSIAVTVTAFELLDVEEYSDLEIYVKGHSRSLEMVPFESLDRVSYSHSIATVAVSVAVSTQYTNLTDTQPDAQPPPNSKESRLCTASRGKTPNRLKQGICLREMSGHLCMRYQCRCRGRP